MKRWLADQLAAAMTSAEPVRIVLDPDRVLATADLSGEHDVIEVEDWFGLRKAWEQQGRRRDPELPPALIILRSDEMSESRHIPWDISQAACVVPVRLPVPSIWRDLVKDLPDELSDRAVAEITSSNKEDRLGAVLSALWGAVLPPSPDPARELESVARLRTDLTVPASLWSLLKPSLQSELASRLASEPPDYDQLQVAWDEWLREGQGSRWDSLFRRISGALAPLFIAGALRPSVAVAADLPNSARIGTREVGPTDRLEELLFTRPTPWLPEDFAGWARAATWWGEVRASLSEIFEPCEFAGSARELWSAMDERFGSWLRDRLWSEIQSAASPPHSVDKIAGFLAKRLRDGTSAKVLLIVLDGMGFAQWSVLRKVCDLKVVSSSACLAMVPTLTPFSRQAIFAGAPPLAFRETLNDTSKDEMRWSEFWRDEGFSSSSVHYTRTSGGAVSELPDVKGTPIAGLVITAVDELLHGAKVIGDPGVTAGVRAWAELGFLRSVVERAVADGYEVWVTSDHGNLEIRPLGAKQEGLAVETAGMRVRLYPTRALRDGSELKGIAWDPPTLPSESVYCLFVPGDGGYFTGDVRVTHGGLSLDEVMVPLVHVMP